MYGPRFFAIFLVYPFLAWLGIIASQGTLLLGTYPKENDGTYT